MTTLLFASHSGAISGAERVLIDIVSAYPEASAFVFEHGDLPVRLKEAGLSVRISQHGQALSGARRDAGIAKLFPMISTLIRITAELMGEVGKADLVYANSQKAFTLAAFACGIRRRKLVWHLHDILSPAHFGKLQRFLQTRLANAFADRVVVPSTAAGQAFIMAGGRQDLVAIVPNGVHRSVDPRTKAELRSALGLPEGRILAGVFSRISPWKGQHIVLEALREVPDLTVIFAGSALFGEHDYDASLREKASDPAIADRAMFLGQRTDVQLLMQAMDIVIHPSIDPEPFGLTLVEAMLAGVALLASDAGASSEILEGGRHGRLFAPGDAHALASALQHELKFHNENPAAAREKITLARQHAQDVYSVERMNASINKVVSVIGRKA